MGLCSLWSQWNQKNTFAAGPSPYPLTNPKTSAALRYLSNSLRSSISPSIVCAWPWTGTWGGGLTFSTLAALTDVVFGQVVTCIPIFCWHRISGQEPNMADGTMLKTSLKPPQTMLSSNYVQLGKFDFLTPKWHHIFSVMQPDSVFFCVCWIWHTLIYLFQSIFFPVSTFNQVSFESLKVFFPPEVSVWYVEPCQ